MPPGSGKPSALGYLHLATLSALAVSPLFSLLGQQAEFFEANQIQPATIVLFTLLLYLALPSLLVLLVYGITRVNPKAAKRLQSSLMFLCALLFAANLFHTLSAPVFAILTLLASGAFMLAYHRMAPIRSFLTLLSFSILAFPAQFLLMSNVTPLLFPKANQALKLPHVDAKRAYPPVVMVIFDEISLSSLLDRRGEIDPLRYPAFARLAKDANWFRGAHTVADNTVDAVPAILIGRYPEGNERTASEQNDNLFTLLGATHQLAVTEKITSLCPPDLCKKDVNLFKNLRKLYQDTSVVYMYLTLPPEWRADLPDITQNWGDFKRDAEDADEKPTQQAPGGLAPEKIGFHYHRVRLFERFVNRIKPMRNGEKPKFYFIHILLPHVPFIFLPSGKYYGSDRSVGPNFPYPWNHDPRLLADHYQRHLLQLATADRLLGSLLDKLQETGLYDQSVVIVMADHGLSSKPGEPRRNITMGNYGDLLSMPLLIKLPRQKQGKIIDKPVKTIDIYPTLADILKIPVPAKNHGKSMFAPDYPGFSQLVVHADKHSDKTGTYPAVTYENLMRQVADKIRVFGEGDTMSLFRIGPHKEWIGKPVAQLGPAVQPAPSGWSASLDNAEAYRHVDLNSRYLPAMVQGSLSVKPGEALPTEVWVAVNQTLWATYPVLEKSGNQLKFYAMAPEEAFKSGQNPVQVLVPVGGNASSLPQAIMAINAQ